MKDNNLTVYWSPATFITDIESWNLLYGDPKPVFSQFTEGIKYSINKNNKTNFFACPATQDLFKNIFYFESNIDMDVNFNIENLGYSQEIDYPKEYFPMTIPNNENGVRLSIVRNKTLNKHFDLLFNVGWIFFSEEPVIARMTSPYFPYSSPIENSILSAGEFDIGQWFRPYFLNYQVPIESNNFKLKSGDPLFYVEIKTDKKVIFKRFENNSKLNNLATECSNSPNYFGKNKKLFSRYNLGKKSNLRERVLLEIKKNLHDL